MSNLNEILRKISFKESKNLARDKLSVDSTFLRNPRACAFTEACFGFGKRLYDSPSWEMEDTPELAQRFFTWTAKIKMFPLLFLLLIAVSGFGANNLTVGSLTLTQTFECIGVRATYTDDDNNNATAIVEYKKTADATWIRAHAPIIDRRTTLVSNDYTGTESNPYIHEARVSLVYLDRATSYDVRVTWTDADGVTGTNPIYSSVATWSHDQPAISAGHTYYVSQSGNDGTGNGNSGSPWLTVTKALTVAVAGDDIKLIGTIAGFTASVSGASGNYIKIESVDHNSPATCASSTIAGNYVWISYVNFSGNLVENSGDYTVIDHCALTNAQFKIQDGSSNQGLLIEHCTISNAVQPTSEAGTGFYINGRMTGGIVFRYNTLSKVWDGVGSAGNFAKDNGYQNSDFYGNDISLSSDDALELDGNAMNLRVWGNKLHDGPLSGYGSGGRVGVSIAGLVVGPAYVWDNVVSKEDYGWKIGNGDGTGYFFNNTIVYCAQAGVANSASGQPKNQLYLNNLFYISGSGKPTFEMPSYSGIGWTIDYNNWDATGATRLKWNGADVSTFSQAQSILSGVGGEVHGISVDSRCTSKDTGDYTLVSSSPLIDAGMTFTGFAKDMAGVSRPQGSAWDIGAYEYVSSGGTAPLITAPTSMATGYTNVASTSVTFIASGTTPVSWTLSSGSLPPGMTLSASGIYGGTPTTAGTYAFIVKATNAYGSNTKSYSQTIVRKNIVPVIDAAASANPAKVTSNSSTVSVSAHDPDSYNNPLTYTWSKTSGPGSVSFSANGTSSNTATAIFSSAGNYMLQVKVTDGIDNVYSSVTVPVNQMLTKILVSPASCTVLMGKTQQITATALDQFGSVLSTQPTFSWSLSGGGTISSTGLFLAGNSSGGPNILTVTGGGKSATATIGWYEQIIWN